MRRLIFIFIITISFISLQSCRTGGVSAELDYIETYINEYPDSALSVLQNINEDLLHGRSNTTITMRCVIYNGTTHVCTAVLPLTVRLNFP